MLQRHCLRELREVFAKSWSPSIVLNQEDIILAHSTPLGHKVLMIMEGISLTFGGYGLSERMKTLFRKVGVSTEHLESDTSHATRMVLKEHALVNLIVRKKEII